MFRMILQLLYVGMPADFKRRFFEESPRAHVTASFLNQVDLGSIPFPKGPPSAWTMVRSGGVLHQKLGKRPLSKRRHTVRRSRGIIRFCSQLGGPLLSSFTRLGPHFLGRAGCGQLNSEQELTLSYKHAVYYSLPFVNARQAEPAPQQRHARSKGGGGETIRIKLYIR